MNRTKDGTVVAELLTVKDVASMLSVSSRQVWKLHASEKIPKPIRLGRSVRWDRQELLAWVKAGCPDTETWNAQKATTSVV